MEFPKHLNNRRLYCSRWYALLRHISDLPSCRAFCANHIRSRVIPSQTHEEQAIVARLCCEATKLSSSSPTPQLHKIAQSNNNQDSTPFYLRFKSVHKILGNNYITRTKQSVDTNSTPLLYCILFCKTGSPVNG